MNKKGNAALILILVVAALLFFMSQDSKTTKSGTQAQDTTQALSGVEVYLTDEEAEDVEEVRMTLTKVEIYGEQHGWQTMYQGELSVRLRLQLMQKIAGADVKPDTFTKIRMTMKNNVVAQMRLGNTVQMQLMSNHWDVEIDDEAQDGEVLTLVLDLPVAAAVQEQNGQLAFKPAQPAIQAQLRAENREQIRQKVMEQLGQAYEVSGNEEVKEVMERFGQEFNPQDIVNQAKERCKHCG